MNNNSTNSNNDEIIDCYIQFPDKDEQYHLDANSFINYTESSSNTQNEQSNKSLPNPAEETGEVVIQADRPKFFFISSMSDCAEINNYIDELYEEGTLFEVYQAICDGRGVLVIISLLETVDEEDNNF